VCSLLPQTCRKAGMNKKLHHYCSIYKSCFDIPGHISRHVFRHAVRQRKLPGMPAKYTCMILVHDCDPLVPTINRIKLRYAHVSQNPRCLAFPRIRSLQDMKMIKMTAREPYKSKSCERGLNFRCLVSKLHGNATMLSHGVTCCPLHSQLLVHSPRKFASRSGAPYATLPEIHGPGMKSCQLDVSAVK